MFNKKVDNKFLFFMNKKADVNLVKVLVWIVFIAIAVVGVIFLLNFLTKQ